MSESTTLNILSPDPVPNEFSSALLSIFESDAVNHDYIKQLVYSLATRTADPMLQYLCSGATYFPNSALSYSALLTALIPLELNAQIQHLKSFIDILPKVFTRSAEAIGSIVDSLNLQLPDSLKELRANLPNPVQNAQQTLQYLIVYYNIDQFIKEQKETFTESLLNTVRISVAWIIAISSYLRLNTLALATNSTSVLTRVGKKDDDLIPSINSSFISVNAYSPSAVDISSIQPLLQSAAIIITTLSTYLDKISEEPEYFQIQSYQKEALSFMNSLQSALDQIRGIPSDVSQQDARIFIQNLFTTVDYFGKSLSQQPEMFASLQSDLKIQAFISFLLFDILKAADTTKLKKLFSQLYAIDNVPGILQKSQEIQNEMQVVNQELYGFTPQARAKPQEEKSNVIKKTTIEEVQVIKTVSEKPKPNIQRSLPEKPPEPIKPQGPVIDPPREIDSVYYTLDFHNTPMLTNALALITCMEAREATIADINEFLNNPDLSLYRTKLEDNVRKVLIMRAENRYLLDISVIAQFDENQCMEKSLDIAAVMPLYAGNEQKAVHQNSLPLFLQNSPTEVYNAVRLLLSYITYIVPLRKRVDQIATIILKEARSVDKEIQETVNIFQIPSRSSGDSDRERDIFDLATFLSYADIMEKGEFYETNIQVWINQLRSHIPMEKTRNIATDMVTSCIATATARRCFDPSVMQNCRAALEALDQYLSKQTEQCRLRLIGCLCLLPTQFNPTGQMDVPWASALALITPTSLNELFSIDSSSLTNHLTNTYSVQTQEDVDRAKAKSETEAKGLMAQLSSSSSDDDDEPEIIYEDIIEEEEVGEPETIEEVEEITVEEEEDETEDPAMMEEVRQARCLENVRNTLHLLKSFNDAAISLEPALVEARYQTLYLSMYELTQLVSPEESVEVTQILQNITAIARQVVVNGDRSSVSQLQSAIDYLKQLKHSLSKKSSSSVVLSELVLLNNYTDQLYNVVEYDPNEVETNNKEPLKKEVIKESRDVLTLIRQLGKKSVKLIQQINDIPHSKPLVKAIAQTSESVQLFYLYIRNTEHNDDVLLRSIVSNGCRKMESSLSCMVMLLPKTLADDYNEIRTINNDIVGHLEYMVDISEQKGASVGTKAAANVQSVETTNDLTEKRLNAEALVIKRRKELSDAEAEVQRLKDA